ncbi:hypothetical protein B0H17DRAFT_1177876 [Mycena rosella]|uniref:Uncharacterized protein n=1 Tax=Mycena rosella TaxID=1033263 RepID=A0AAD7DST9_MYCRO|nr:hypothetical protein B0H17DRAFT_1177876 [Mycena rosella]
MSSRASTPESDDDFQTTLNAMNQSSPVVPPQGSSKRTHQTMSQDNDEDNETTSENEQSLATVPRGILPNQNLVAVAKRYVERKRLRTDQATEVEVFLNPFTKDSASVRDVKMFISMFALENKIDKIVTAKVPYQVSPDLNKNILNYAPAVLLSSKVTAYKGQAATTILLALLKKHRFDLPAGIENIPADWAKIEASLKLNKNYKEQAPPAKQQNIFELTSAIVQGTKCSVNVVLCARVALMRSVYIKHPGAKYWDKVDDRLAKIRKQAEGDATKVVKAFRQLLKVDRETHGVNDYHLDEETVDEFQQQVDDVIDAGIVDASVQGADGGNGGNEGE